MRTALLSFLFGMAVGLSLVSATGPEDLNYLTEDYPPDNYLENGVLRGFSVDILGALWKQMGVPAQPIQVYPWARALAQRGPNQVLFSTARNPEREVLFQWVGPIYEARYSLFTLGDRVAPVTSLREVSDRVVGVIHGDHGEDFLRDARFPPGSLYPVNSLSQALKMLKAGRLDLVCTGMTAIQREVALDPSLAGAYLAVLLVDKVQVYYAFSQGTDPALVQRFQTALAAIDPLRRQILRRYAREE